MFAPLHLTTDARTTLTISPRPAGILPGSLAGVAPVRGAACNNMEVFKDVVGYEGRYMVSNMGRVKSLNRTVSTPQGPRAIRGMLLRPYFNVDGYLLVNLYINSKMRICRINRLVAAAFIGPCPEGMECCHNDGSRTNNVVDNLRYDTRVGNAADRLLHGTHQRGERSGNSKLTEAQVLAIRADTRLQGIIAEEYGIEQACVSKIKLRKSWAWLT